MTSTSIAAFSRRTAASLAASYGQTVTIGGTDYTAVVSTATPPLDIEAGGFRSPASFILRITKEAMETPPATKTAVVIDGTTYRVTSIRKAISPLAQEWIIEVETA